MNILAFLLAAVGAAAAPDNNVTSITCNLTLPDRSKFQLAGSFNDAGLHSNLSDLIRNKGVFAGPAEPVIVTDGTERYGWSLDDKSESQKFDATLTRYGRDAALFVIERRKFVGRHWNRSLIGVGLCKVRRRQAAGKAS